MGQQLRILQSLWPMEQRRAGEAEWPLHTQLAMIREADFDGAGVRFIDPGICHVRDEHRSPLYRTYRGESLPVYRAPPGLATLERRRGERTWMTCLFVEEQLTNSMLTLLGQRQKLFLSIHEMKKERQRWIRNISLQTTDLTEE